MPKILVMCGGRGKRLNKLTEKTPKPLVRFQGRTILEFKIEQYVGQGFDDFIFCLSPPDKISIWYVTRLYVSSNTGMILHNIT